MSTWDITLGDLSLMDATYCVTALDTTTPGRVRVTLYIDGPDEPSLIDAVRALEQKVNEATRRSMPTSVSSWLMLSVKPEGSESVRYAVRRGTVTVPRTQVGGIQMSEGWIDGIQIDLECLPYTLGNPIDYEAVTVTGRQPWFVIQGIPGDEPALVEMRVKDQSSGPVINRMLIGSRSGLDSFTPVVPFVTDGESGAEDDDTFTGWVARDDAGTNWTDIASLVGDAGLEGLYDIYARVADGTTYLGQPGTPEANFTSGISLRRIAGGISNGTWGSSATSVTATFSQPSLAGSLLIAVIGTTNGQSITTPAGWTQIFNVAHGGGTGPRLAAFYLENAPVTSSLTITHGNSSSYLSLTEWLGIKPSGSLDASNSTTGTNTTSGSTGATGSLDQANSLVLAMFATHGGTTPGIYQITLGAGWANAGGGGGIYPPHAQAPHVGVATGWQVPTTTSTITGSASTANTRNWVGGIAAFTGKLATAPELPPGTYQFCVAALNANSEWGIASDVTTITTTNVGAINLEWAPASGPVTKYRVYCKVGSGAWGYWETDDDTPAYMVSTTSGTTTGNPPTSSPIDQADLRLQLALASGTTVDLSTPPYTSLIANDTWEPALLTRGPLPAAAEEFDLGNTGWMARIQAIANATRSVSVDSLLLMPADEQQIDVQYLPGNLAIPREWVIGTTPALRTYAWLRDPGTGAEAGRLHALGYCLAGPGDTTFVLLMTTTGGVWQIDDVEAEINMTVIPRYRWLAGGV